MTLSWRVFVTVDLSSCVERFSAFTVTLNVPTADGVPVIVFEVPLKLNPEGSPVTVRVMGAVPVAVKA